MLWVLTTASTLHALELGFLKKTDLHSVSTMVNLLNSRLSNRCSKPKKLSVLRTLFFLGLFTIVGALIGVFIGEAVPMALKVLFLAAVIGAAVGGASQHKSEVGRNVNGFLRFISRWDRFVSPGGQPIKNSGYVLIGAITGAIVVGTGAAFIILDINNYFFNVSSFLEQGQENPKRLLFGGVFGAALFIFRGIFLKRRTWSTWKVDDINIYKTIGKKRTKRKEKPAAQLDLTGVLQECPTCRKKQKTTNDQCTCGEDLRRARKSEQVNYWMTCSVPGVTERKEFIGHSIEMAARHAAAKRKASSLIQKKPHKDK